MRMTDCHVHTNFSVDAHDSVMDMCKTAMEKGISVLGITDHIDLDPSDAGFGRYDRSAHFREIERARNAFSGTLKVLKGIEFGEIGSYPVQFAEFTQAGYDMILGSLHMVSGLFVSDPKLAARHGIDGFSRLYFEETLKMVRKGGFDVLAHLDFPKRYQKIEYPSGLVDEILRALVEKGIALEVNTSTFRHGIPESCPSQAIVRRYAELGGRRLTLGSDAHRMSDIASGFGETLKELGSLADFLGYFEKRKFVSCGASS